MTTTAFIFFIAAAVLTIVLGLMFAARVGSSSVRATRVAPAVDGQAAAYRRYNRR